MVSIIKVLRTNNVPIVNKCFPARYVKKNKRYEPFPNLYWLDHQKLDLMISNLERIGVINDLEDRLNNDNVAMKLFMNQHLRYVHQRNKLFYDDELKLKLDLNINDENIKWLHDNLYRHQTLYISTNCQPHTRRVDIFAHFYRFLRE